MVQIILQQADITKLSVDAIVNAANSSLLGGGGVDGAIHRAGGKEILDACKAIRARQGKCKTGEAVITTAGKLPAKYVIHTVGPVWSHQKTEAELAQLLRNCYLNSLALGQAHQVRSIAFPNISTGVYRYPKMQAAQEAISAVQSFIQQEPNAYDQILFICFDNENYRIYQQLLA